MRVALVFKRFSRGGGSERQLVMLAEHLAARGDEVHVFCAEARAAAPAGVVLHAMGRRVPGRLLGLVAFSLWARRAVARHEERAGPFDVRHAFGRTLGQDVYRLGGGSHRTYLAHAHALDRPAWLRPLLARTPYQLVKAALEERAILSPRTRAILVNSALVRDDLLARYELDPDLLHVVRNGVDLVRFRPPAPGERAGLRRALGLDEHDQVVLFLGTGYARKGLDVALRAVAQLARERNALRLVVAGGESRPRRWARLARTLGIASRVHLLGRCAEPERLYRVADVYVLPTAYDPAANTTLEALASGLPVVTSAMNGAGEILAAGLNGSVVPCPVHPGDLAAELARWLDAPDPPRVAAAARALAERHPIEASAAATRAIHAALAPAQPAATPAFAK